MTAARNKKMRQRRVPQSLLDERYNGVWWPTPVMVTCVKCGHRGPEDQPCATCLVAAANLRKKARAAERRLAR